MKIEEDQILVTLGNNIQILLPRLKACGERYSDPLYYIRSGMTEAHRLWDFYNLTGSSKLLDVGCGKGRIATGLILSNLQPSYIGIDVDPWAIAWGQHYITPQYPSLKFAHLDVKHTQYNPEGAPLNEGFQFPFPDDEFDIIYLWSVLNHMVAADIRIYLKEFQRILKPDGRIFASVCFDEGVQTWRFQLESTPAILNTYFNPRYFEHLLCENGLYSYYTSTPLLAYGAIIHPNSLSELQIRKSSLLAAPEYWSTKTVGDPDNWEEALIACEKDNIIFLKDLNK